MVEYLKINGKEYPFRFGYYVMKRIKEKTGSGSFSEAMTKHKEDLELHEVILYAGLKAGAFAEKQELDLREEDMEMVLDSCFLEYLKAISSGKFFPKEMDKLTAELTEAPDPEKKE